MRWLGHFGRVVLAKTKLGIVFRSVDEGRHWKRLGPDKENKVIRLELALEPTTVSRWWTSPHQQQTSSG